ncbi:MAG: hypothetical protein V2I54_12145 [Bacteroidales bacterium]|nr:hypothetical protein [Bacteroidales bacterium]
MRNQKIYVGKSLYHFENKEVKGDFVQLDGEQYYKISNYDQMPDFFISLISSSDQWLFISSTGSLTAGRKNRDNALFPYYTVDKIHDYKGITGSTSCFILEKENNSFLWEPFTDIAAINYRIERNIYKSFFGDKIVFEEINRDLELSFRYCWCSSEKFGFVKRSRLVNASDQPKIIHILDGIRNILPPGIDYKFQNELSNLLDAYKKNELIKESGLGLFTLSAIPVDRAEPSESFYATTVWNTGLDHPGVLISARQVELFKKGHSLKPEQDIRARRGAYFVNSQITLEKDQSKEWMIIAEINQDSAGVHNLNHWLVNSTNHAQEIRADIYKGTETLKRIASAGDGLQLTDNALTNARHYSNTIYNIMRGGIFTNNYVIDVNDFKHYLVQINKLLAAELNDWLNQLPERMIYTDLLELAEKSQNGDLIRITYEYLPLAYSRRHGDPSRPWNIFSIETRNPDGSLKYHYEGNWRDIFQNWEALCLSFPGFIEGIICKFVNASTIDGYNPYRIMRNGIDWECPDPEDPWAYIGYWGDHQIIYLLKFLEHAENYHPGMLDALFEKEIFTYANVPYRIKSYDEIVINPKSTIAFDHELNNLINAMEEHVGADAKVIKNKEVGKAYKVNLLEKILVTLLSKLSNFVPEAGIWLNTQRPEWNDANNALVGNGTSMVTLYYIRRFLKFLENKLVHLPPDKVPVSIEVADLYENIFKIFRTNEPFLCKGFSDADRKNITDRLGYAHEKYRTRIYSKQFNGKKRDLKIAELLEFTALCLSFIDQSISKNQREDGLYHAYNLIAFNGDQIIIRHLYEMLEGQVAVLSSGFLSPDESLGVLDALKKSLMFRPDQNSYMLYPDRVLPGFIVKNNIPAEKIESSGLLKELIRQHDARIIKADHTGKYHFNSDFRNAELLRQALDKLNAAEYKALNDHEKQNILDIYEEMFDHQSFTGRSGTFFGYEGLGSIYWHMVSKLLLATQETYFRAVDENSKLDTINRLKDHYYDIKAGIGLTKSPEQYGAFPTDAYSHTPARAGVKQPGLTGQVKEDIISRFGELGIRVQKGEIHFAPSLLNHHERLTKSADFQFYSLDGVQQTIALEQKQMAFTFCQVPIVYTDAEEDQLIITFTTKDQITISGNVLTHNLSKQIFQRQGGIKQIDVLRKNENSV